MTDLLAELFADLGRLAWDPFWMPITAWTLLAAGALAVMAFVPAREVFLRRDLHFALLLALPAGLVVSRLLGGMPGANLLRTWWQGPAFVAPVTPPEMTLSPVFEPDPAGIVSIGAPVLEPSIDPAVWIGLGTLLAALVASVALVLLLVAVVRLRRLLAGATPDGALRLANGREVRILRSERVQVPFSCGVFRPTIVLPDGPLPDRDVIVAHEAAHHEHRDVARLWSAGLVHAAFAFHPLVHLLSSRLTWLMEAACDRATLERTGLPASRYSEVLLRAVPQSAPRALRVALPMGRSVKELRSRIVALGHATNPARRGPMVAVSTLSVFLVAMMAVAAAGVAASDAPVQVISEEIPPVLGVNADLVSVEILSGGRFLLDGEETSLGIVQARLRTGDPARLVFSVDTASDAEVGDHFDLMSVARISGVRWMLFPDGSVSQAWQLPPEDEDAAARGPGIATDSLRPTGAMGSGRIVGTVSDGKTGEPIRGSLVYVNELHAAVPTNPDGSYSISGIPPGTYTVRLDNFRSLYIEREVKVADDETVEVDFRTEGTPVSLNVNEDGIMSIAGITVPTNDLREVLRAQASGDAIALTVHFEGRLEWRQEQTLRASIESAVGRASRNRYALRWTYGYGVPTDGFLDRRQGTVRGRVTRADNGEALPGATVFVAGTRLGSASGPNGEYVIQGVPAGRQEIVASYVGFVPMALRDVNVPDGGTIKLDFAMNPQTYPTGGVTVTAPLPTPPLSDLPPLPPPPPPPGSEPPEPGEVFVIVEDMPELIGGLDGLQEQVVYPEIARRAGIEGRVIVQFLVRPDGSVAGPVVVRGIGGGCDEEALRVVSEARFKPGAQRGQPVTVRMSLPITFRLIRGSEREMEITVDEEGVIRLDGQPSSLDDIRALENLDWSKTRLTILGWENTPQDVLKRVKSVVAGFANGHVQPVTGTIMGMNSRKDVETTPRLDPPRNAPAGERPRIVLDVSPTGGLTMNGAPTSPDDIPGTIDWENYDVLLRWLNPGSSEQAAITYSLVYERLRNAGINPSTQLGDRYNDRSGRASQGTRSRQDVNLDRAVRPPPGDSEREVFVIVESMPELIGGLDGLQEKVVYPKLAAKAGVQGRVIVQFLVEPDGSVSNPVIVRGIGAGCDEEALRVVQTAKFTPGTQRGIAVPVRMSLPITFKLDHGAETPSIAIEIREDGSLMVNGVPTTLDDLSKRTDIDWANSVVSFLPQPGAPPEMIQRVREFLRMPPDRR